MLIREPARPRMRPIVSCRRSGSTAMPSTAMIWSPLRIPERAAGEPVIGVTTLMMPSMSATSTPTPV